MKTIKYILSVWTILSLSLLCFSCMEEEVPKNDQNWCDGKTLRLTLNAPESRVVSPMTKSAQADTILTDLNVLIYQNGTLTQGFYYEGNHDVITQLKGGKTKQLSIELPPNTEGSIYAVANYKGKIEVGNTEFGSESDLTSAQFNIEGMQPKTYMYANGGSFNVDDPNQNKITLALKRIYALVTVKVVKNLTPQPVGGTFDVVPTSLQIKNIPTKGQFADDNKISQSSESEDGEILIPLEGDNSENFLSADHAEARAFYLYENRQPEGSNGGSQTTKTPAGMPADEIISIIKTNRTCSYIEMHGKYIRNGNEEGLGSGSIIYRFFLGKDVLTNFDVERNVHYQVTLTLNGKGGADEATWRVETELIGEIQVPDVYVGYRAGSKTRMDITGSGIEFIKGIEVKVTHTPTGGSNANFKFTAVKTDEKGAYIEIEADATNAHDYDKKTGLVTFNVNGNGLDRNFTAKIYQVPRLVDPIAFYKKATNVDPVHIKVKEYDPNQRAYIDLNSKGPWTATIKHSAGSANDWYGIYNTDEHGNKTGEVVNQQGGVIRGEGPVQFGYMPLSSNTYADGDEGALDKARYGMIQVRYHNDWCEHEIYLRQGYQPTTMGDSDYPWSMFNCLGKKSKSETEVGTVVAYPTQTGWLFNGGTDVAMHPFIPGYGLDEPTKLKYSDGETGYRQGKYPGTVDSWGYISNKESEYSEVQSDGSVKKNPLKMKWAGEQGPCPTGYVVATAPTYRTMTDASEVYTGYVHDDDPIKGWRYGSNGAEVDDDNHCNPAKGSLFIRKDNGYTNVFFNYGKAVKTDANKADPKLIPEIGVGFRNVAGTRNQFLMIQGGYGGFYWNGTPFYSVSAYHPEAGGAGTHMGKVDFSYNIFRREPNLLDVPGYLASIGGVYAIGIDRTANASFVRCVKDLKPVQYREITLGGKFYQNSNSNSPKNLTIQFYLKGTVVDGKEKVAVTVTVTNGEPEIRTISVPIREDIEETVIIRTSNLFYGKIPLEDLAGDKNKNVRSGSVILF